jgi:hypothetical protein
MSLDFEQARFSTHEKLVDKLAELARGKDIKSLESFAKAYLGMYLDLDKALLPDERVRLLADDDILDSIWSGFDAVLNSRSLSTPEAIGCKYAKDERLAEGYIALAAMDRRIRNHNDDVADIEVDDDVIESLVCFHYVDRNELENRWMDYVVRQRTTLFSEALLRFWHAIQDCGLERYPGFREVLLKKEFDQALQQLVLPVLQTIARINRKLLPTLLLKAFRCVPHQDLLQTCRMRLNSAGYMPVVHHVYWLGAAYLLAADEFETQLFDYVGRTREKALPLLNFIDTVVRDADNMGLDIGPDMLAKLLYMIAPKFRPGRDQFGRVDDNVQKVIYLFDLLGRDNSQEARQAVQRLRRIRVMRLYSDYLDRVEQAQLQVRPGQG